MIVAEEDVIMVFGMQLAMVAERLQPHAADFSKPLVKQNDVAVGTSFARHYGLRYVLICVPHGAVRIYDFLEIIETYLTA